MERPKVYSKENCVQCTATTRKLGQLGIAYDLFMLEEEPEMLEEFKQEGLMQAPIVEANGERWAGYKPDRLKAIEV